MLGTNPKRPPEKHDGTTLFVQSIFKTLQGEGMFTGHPAIFVRLGGCNLACDFCDTEFESFTARTLHEIIQDIEEKSGTPRTHSLVVITGGEPFRQNLTPLCNALLERKFRIQIETNGTLFQALPSAVQIVCSPKKTGAHYAPIRPDMLKQITALKFIVSRTHPLYQRIEEVGQSELQIPVYVQPMDEKNAEKNAQNLAYAVEIAMKHGHILSLQTHKIIGIE